MRRIFGGERDLASLTADIDDMDTACVQRILQLIKELGANPAKSLDFPGVEALLEPKPNVKGFIMRHHNDFQELAECIDDPDIQGEWEEGELSQWEDQGWKVKRSVRRLWRGERNLGRLARGADRNSRDVVAAILEEFKKHDATVSTEVPQDNNNNNNSSKQPRQAPQTIGVKDARKYSVGGRYTFRNGGSTVTGVVLSITPCPKPSHPNAGMARVEPEDATLFDTDEPSRDRQKSRRKKSKRGGFAEFFDQFIDDPEHPVLQQLYADHPEARQMLAHKSARKFMARQVRADEESSSDDDISDRRGTIGIASHLGDGSTVHAGDLVVFSAELGRAQMLQNGHGGYASHMQCYHGKVGLVKSVDPDRDVRVRYSDGQRLCYNPMCLSAAPPGSTLTDRNELYQLRRTFQQQFQGSDTSAVSSASVQKVMDFTGCTEEQARTCLDGANGDVQVACSMIFQ
eukprot:SAG31_NODE_2225_length_6150_cov_2.229549_3_plen_458_part_00